MAKLILKKHIRNGCLDLAICDSIHLNKTYSENEKELDLKGSFFDGEETNPEEIFSLIDKARSALIVGEISTKIVKEKYPDCSVLEVDKVPFINIFKV